MAAQNAAEESIYILKGQARSHKYNQQFFSNFSGDENKLPSFMARFSKPWKHGYLKFRTSVQILRGTRVCSFQMLFGRPGVVDYVHFDSIKHGSNIKHTIWNLWYNLPRASKLLD